MRSSPSRSVGGCGPSSCGQRPALRGPRARPAPSPRRGLDPAQPPTPQPHSAHRATGGPRFGASSSRFRSLQSRGQLQRHRRESLIIEVSPRYYVTKTIHTGGLVAYEPETQALLLGLAEVLTPQVVFDVGANVGPHALLLPALLDVPVIAFEPAAKLPPCSGSWWPRTTSMHRRRDGCRRSRWNRDAVHLAHGHVDVAASRFPPGHARGDGAAGQS